MEGLLKQPPIVEELLQCITPIEYMVLRRACPIFIRNPTRFPTVEEMGCFKEIFPNAEDNSGFAVLLALHGEPISCNIHCNSIDILNSVYYSEKHGVKIANLGDAVKRIYHANTCNRASLCLYRNTRRSWIYCRVRATFEIYEEYAKCGFTVFVHHDADETGLYIADESEEENDDDDDDDGGRDFSDEDEIADCWNECIKRNAKQLKRADIIFINE